MEHKHKHIYDAEGNQLCCTQQEKIYIYAGVKDNEFFNHNQIL